MMRRARSWWEHQRQTRATPGWTIKVCLGTFTLLFAAQAVATKLLS